MSQKPLYRDRRSAPFVVDRHTVRLLLLPEPPLALAYLVGVHTRIIEPGFAPLLIIAALPLAAAAIAVAGLRTAHHSRRRNWAVLSISLVELLSAGLSLAAVAFALTPHPINRAQPTSAMTVFSPHDDGRDRLPGSPTIGIAAR